MRTIHILRCLFSVMLLVGFHSLANAQAPMSETTLDFSYDMQLGDGTNGSAVTWHPKSQLYVTVIAGNEEFPLEVFGPQGEAMVQSSAGFDWRGLWYNPATNAIEGNGAGESGYATFDITTTSIGRPSSIKEGQLQPEFQSVGAYDPLKKQVVFIDFSCDGLGFYSRKNPKKYKDLSLDWSEVEIGNVNVTSVGYTGHTGYEFVLLNFVEGKLEFFNRGGKHTASTQLPSDAPLYDLFAFSFANDHAFLYDKDNRVWQAYRVW